MRVHLLVAFALVGLGCRSSEGSAKERAPALPSPPAVPAPTAALPYAWVVPEDRIDVIAFSPDARWVAVADEHSTARVFETATGTEWLAAEGNDANGVAFAGPSTLVVVSQQWSPETKKAHSTLTQIDVGAKKTLASAQLPGRAEIAPCGDAVVAGSYDPGAGSVSLHAPLKALWSAAVEARGPVACGGEIVAAATGSGIQLVDRVTGAKKAKLDAALVKDDYVYGVAVDRAGTRIAGVSHRGDLRVWGADGALLAWRPGAGNGKSIAFSPDGALLLSGDTLLDPRTLTVFHRRSGDGVDAAVFTPDGAHVVWAVGPAAFPHAVATLLATPPPEGVMGGVTSVAIDPSGTFAVVGCREGRLTFIDLDTSATRRVIEAHRGDVNALQFLGADRVLSGGGDEALHEWDTKTGARVRSVDVPESAQVEDVRFSANGKRFLVRGWNHVSVFARDGTRVRVFGPFPGATSQGAGTNGADLDATGERVAVTLDGKRAVVLRVADGVELAAPVIEKEKYGIGAPRFLPGDTLLLSHGDATRLHRISDGAVTHVWNELGFDEGELSADGKQLLHWSWSGNLGVLPLDSRVAARRSTPEDEYQTPGLWYEHAPWHVGAAAWDPKRARVWSGGPDIALTGWNRTTGKKEKAIYGAIGEHVEALAFSADGTRVAVAHERQVSVWNVTTHALVGTRAVPDEIGGVQALVLEGNVLTAFDSNASHFTWTIGTKDVTLGPHIEDVHVGAGGHVGIGREWLIAFDEYSGEAQVRARSGSVKPKSLESWTEDQAGEIEGFAIDGPRSRIATLHVFVDTDGETLRGEVRVRDRTGKRILTRAVKGFATLAFDPKGRLLVMHHPEEEEAPIAEWWTLPAGTVERWNIEPRAAHVFGPTPVFSLDGTKAAFADRSHVWIVGLDGRLQRIVDVASEGVLEELAWSPDGKRLAVGTRHEGDIRIFDASNGARIATYRLRKDGTPRVCVASKGCLR